MITSRAKYEDRHRRVIARCEQRLRERQEEDPSLTIDAIVDDYARDVRKAIERRDSIAAVLAVMAAHLAMRKSSDSELFAGTNWTQTEKGKATLPFHEEASDAASAQKSLVSKDFSPVGA